MSATNNVAATTKIRRSSGDLGSGTAWDRTPTGAITDMVPSGRATSVGRLDAFRMAPGECLVGARIGLDPEARAFAERTGGLARRPAKQRLGLDDGVRWHQRTGSDHRAITDPGAVLDDRTVADQRLAAHGGAVQHTQVSDRRALADDDRRPGRSVHDRTVLHVGAGPHDDRAVVGPQDDAVPDRRAGLNSDVAYQRCGRCDEGIRMHDGALALEGEQWHVSSASSSAACG